MEQTGQPTWADLVRAIDVVDWASELAEDRPGDEWFAQAAADAVDRMRALFDERPDLRQRFVALSGDGDPDRQRAAFAELEADLADLVALRDTFRDVIPPAGTAESE
jgi:hypothetical protein